MVLIPPFQDILFFKNFVRLFKIFQENILAII